MSIPKGDCNDAVRTFLGTKVMNNKKISRAQNRGLTLLEMVMSLTIILIIFATILPQFRNIQNSWASKQGAAEAVQNARVVMDFLNRHLTQAAKITAVSNPADTRGFIEFEDNKGNTIRCEIGANDYIQYGDTAQGLFDLAGPASKLQFTCYALDDLDTPTTDAESIRLVKVETILTNTAALGQDKAFITQAYIRSNIAKAITTETPFEHDIAMGQTPALVQIDPAHYLCAYHGASQKGYASVLTVDPADWTVSKGMEFVYKINHGTNPALAKVDDTHYLCVYAGASLDGWAVVLVVDPADWSLSKETDFEYNTTQGKTPAVAQIDPTHYLCVYTGPDDDGWAVVLTVNTGTWTISDETAFEFDTSRGNTPALAKIDDTHYLCAYRGSYSDGWATVLTVDTGNWTITKQTPFEFDSSNCQTPELARIDNTHYLCAYSGPGDDGYAVVLMVNTGTWTISKGASHEYDPTGYAQGQALALIDGQSYLCVYSGHTDPWAQDGWSTVLSAGSGNWTVRNGPLFEWDNMNGESPALARIDTTHYLCVYEGPHEDGWAVVLEADVLVRP